MKQHYVDRKFTPRSRELIGLINGVLEDYRGQGYRLTVRQVFYQMVTRNAIANTMKEYKNLASLLNDARLAGLVDWDMIEDRTRGFKDRAHWEDGKSFMESVIPQFFADLWEGQEMRPFVVIEKEALTGVLRDVCHKWDVPLLAARGYPSASVLREFAIWRMMQLDGVTPVVIHLGDHDPSGIDMTNDLKSRLNLFCENIEYKIERIALNIKQVREKKLAPNPAKLTDARAKNYVAQFGRDSWELDALEPAFLNKLVEKKIRDCIDEDVWRERVDWVDRERARLMELTEGLE